MLSVSVLMPVFNGEKYLGAAAESILAQTYPDFELVILDDGSTDGSLRMLRQFRRGDPRIRIISREHRGFDDTANQLIGLARGEYVALMAQDDIALPERLALQVAFLRSNPEVLCVGGSFEVIDGDGRFLTILRQPETDQDIQRLNLAGHNSFHSACVTSRREPLLALGGFDPSFFPSEDLDLWLRLGEIGKLANLREPVLRYRMHSSSISAQTQSQMHVTARRACERAWQRRGIRGNFEATEDWRPRPDRDSRHKFMLLYGWWAFNSRERQTAIIYGWRAIRAKPLEPDGWRLFLCALLKPFRAQR
jgi:glycosyltransferase involved in cell wall biosynthesis